jgi:hypothetical protein
MAKSVRISDGFYALLELEARLEHRSIAQQLEYWATIGMARTRSSVMESSASYSVEAAAESTRRKDVHDVASGRRTADSLHFIPRSLARDAKPDFSKRFVKG